MVRDDGEEQAYQDRFTGLVLGELRSFRREVSERLDKLVTQEAFQAEQRRVDERIKDLQDDATADRAASSKGIADEQASRIRAFVDLEKKSERVQAWVKWLVGAALVPTVLFVADRIMDGSIG